MRTLHQILAAAARAPLAPAVDNTAARIAAGLDRPAIYITGLRDTIRDALVPGRIVSTDPDTRTVKIAFPLLAGDARLRMLSHHRARAYGLLRVRLEAARATGSVCPARHSYVLAHVLGPDSAGGHVGHLLAPPGGMTAAECEARAAAGNVAGMRLLALRRPRAGSARPGTGGAGLV